jgi:hypothetical protein
LLRTLEDCTRMEYEENSIQKEITVKQDNPEDKKEEIEEIKETKIEENIIDSTFKSSMKSTIICHHCKNVIPLIINFSRFQSKLKIILTFPFQSHMQRRVINHQRRNYSQKLFKIYTNKKIKFINFFLSMF